MQQDSINVDDANCFGICFEPTFNHAQDLTLTVCANSLALSNHTTPFSCPDHCPSISVAGFQGSDFILDRLQARHKDNHLDMQDMSASRCSSSSNSTENTRPTPNVSTSFSHAASGVPPLSSQLAKPSSSLQMGHILLPPDHSLCGIVQSALAASNLHWTSSRDCEGSTEQDIIHNNSLSIVASNMPESQPTRTVDTSTALHSRGMKLENFLSSYNIEGDNTMQLHSDSSIFGDANNLTTEWSTSTNTEWYKRLHMSSGLDRESASLPHEQCGMNVIMANPNLTPSYPSNNLDSTTLQYTGSMCPGNRCLQTCPNSTHDRTQDVNAHSTLSKHLSIQATADKLPSPSPMNLACWPNSESYMDTLNAFKGDTTGDPIIKEQNGSSNMLSLFDPSQLSLSMTPSKTSNPLTGNVNTFCTADVSRESSSITTDSAKQNSPDPGQASLTVENTTRKSIESFGQRTSIYRGVTKHRWTGRFEAHLWDNSCRREGQTRKGRQVYLGGYDNEEKAARAYDLAALKYWGPTTTINFKLEDYERELEEMKTMTRQEFVASLRRKSSGFSRGASIYRGVTRHHQHGRWQARIGRVAGNKDLYLGTFATQEEAAEAYDIAAIRFRGMNAVTNFDMSRYDVAKICSGNGLPITTFTKRMLKDMGSLPSSSSHSLSSVVSFNPLQRLQQIDHFDQGRAPITADNAHLITQLMYQSTSNYSNGTVSYPLSLCTQSASDNACDKKLNGGMTSSAKDWQLLLGYSNQYGINGSVSMDQQVIDATVNNDINSGIERNSTIRGSNNPMYQFRTQAMDIQELDDREQSIPMQNLLSSLDHHPSSTANQQNASVGFCMKLSNLFEIGEPSKEQSCAYEQLIQPTIIKGTGKEDEGVVKVSTHDEHEHSTYNGSLVMSNYGDHRDINCCPIEPFSASSFKHPHFAVLPAARLAVWNDG
ncbi:hypothetical protein KP509_32G008600 [Ceratopteris richardii]|uniref:AP2/ERF domain-containing protein n=1 Tax=Ceratopteris richardii TaxID=49495 RepID=A0A8T2QS93_CERRI|nr:hypothetical protein KP509_32G008600 [Ceratopteris richardii]